MEEKIQEVFQGDCLEIMPEIPDKSIDMILCDLPYQITGQKWDKIIDLEEMWQQYKRIIKDNGAIVLTANQPFTSKLIISNPKMFKYQWVWVKGRASNFQLCKKQPLRKEEEVVVFYKNQPTYNPQGLAKLDKPIKQSNKNKAGRLGHLASEEKREYYYQEYTNYPDNILRFDGDRGLHPTQKPVALFEYLIKTYTNENDLVLDNAAGSMTTAIACLNTNRDYICIEKEEEYYNMGLKRIEEHKAKLYEQTVRLHKP